MTQSPGHEPHIDPELLRLAKIDADWSRKSKRPSRAEGYAVALVRLVEQLEAMRDALDLIKLGCELAREDLKPELTRIHEVASEALDSFPAKRYDGGQIIPASLKHGDLGEPSPASEPKPCSDSSLLNWGAHLIEKSSVTNDPAEDS